MSQSSTAGDPTLAKPVSHSAADRDAAFHKVVMRLVPFLTLLWFIAWIDRTNVGFAKIDMLGDLGWSEIAYGTGAGVFFLGYFIFEVPSNLLLRRIGAPKTFMRIALGWGVVSVLMAFVQTEWQFYIMRFLLGTFEAGLQPGAVLFLMYWLPAHRRGKALAVFSSATALSLIMGSPIAGGIMTAFEDVAGLHGWQWLFIIEGMPSIIIGALCIKVLTDRPENATWLTAEEREHVLYELDAEDKSMEHREEGFWASLKYGSTWVLITSFFCIIAANSTLTYYGPSIMKDLGVTDNLTYLGLIMSAIYLCGYFGMIGNGWLADRTREARWTCAGAALMGSVGLAGAAVFLHAESALGVFICLCFATAGTMGAIPVYWNLPAFYMSGTALVAGLAVINSIANLAGYMAPQLLSRIKNATDSYTNGLYLIAGVELISVLLILFAVRKQKIYSPEDDA